MAWGTFTRALSLQSWEFLYPKTVKLFDEAICVFCFTGPFLTGLLGQTVGTVKMENMPPPQLTEASTVGEGSLSAGQAAGSTNSESSNQLTADQLPLDEKWSLNLGLCWTIFENDFLF